MNRRTPATLVSTGWGALVMAAVVALPLGFRDRLPGRLATHWSGSTPDGSSSFAVIVAVCCAMWAVAWVVLVATAAHGRVLGFRYGRMLWWGFLVGGGAFCVAMTYSLIAANMDRSNWQDARMVPWTLVLALAIAPLVGALAAYLGRGPKDVATPAEQNPPTLRTRPNQRSVWVGRLTNPWLVLASAGATAVLLAAALLAGLGVIAAPAWVLVVVAVATFVPGFLLSAVRVRVTPGGVRVGLGPLGWPSRTISLGRIEKAWAQEARPGQVGGWGLRGIPGRAALMLRAGDALVLGYRDGGRFLISVDDAERGAALINTLITDPR